MKIQEKWIDFHCHALPDIDDGSRSVGESLKMFQREAAQGVGIIIATPHFYADQDLPELFLRRRDRAEKMLRQVWAPDLPRVGFGAEVAYFVGMKNSEELRTLCIRGTNLLLVEMPFCHWTEDVVQDIIFLQSQRGFQVLLAHVERYLGFHNAEGMDQLQAAGVQFQVNAGSFLHWQTRGKVIRLLRQGKIQVLGSDSHNLTTRPPNLESAVQTIEKECGTIVVRRLRRNAERLLYGAVENQRRGV